jgi:cytochrome c553
MKKLKYHYVSGSLFMMLVVTNVQAAGDAAVGESAYSAMGCVGCHGAAGTSVMPDTFPTLSGLEEEYIVAQLKAFRGGERENAIMQPMSAGLKDEDIANVAAYLAAQKGK